MPRPEPEDSKGATYFIHIETESTLGWKTMQSDSSCCYYHYLYYYEQVKGPLTVPGEVVLEGAADAQWRRRAGKMLKMCGRQKKGLYEATHSCSGKHRQT